MNHLFHLPEEKQNELAEIVTIIQEVADPAKIILFGSHTSDKWVEDEYYIIQKAEKLEIIATQLCQEKIDLLARQ